MDGMDSSLSPCPCPSSLQGPALPHHISAKLLFWVIFLYYFMRLNAVTAELCAQPAAAQAVPVMCPVLRQLQPLPSLQSLAAAPHRPLVALVPCCPLSSCFFMCVYTPSATWGLCFKPTKETQMPQ